MIDIGHRSSALPTTDGPHRCTHVDPAGECYTRHTCTRMLQALLHKAYVHEHATSTVIQGILFIGELIPVLPGGQSLQAEHDQGRVLV